MQLGGKPPAKLTGELARSLGLALRKVPVYLLYSYKSTTTDTELTRSLGLALRKVLSTYACVCSRMLTRSALRCGRLRAAGSVR